MKKSELTILERAFSAEIEGALNRGFYLFQSHTKAAERLADAGYLERVEVTVGGRFPVTVKGYALTHLGRSTYCATCPDPDAQGVTE